MAKNSNLINSKLYPTRQSEDNKPTEIISRTKQHIKEIVEVHSNNDYPAIKKPFSVQE